MKTTVATLKKMKEENNKITMLTCYDYSTAKLMDAVGVEILLVGDSLGNTMLGYENTLPVTMEDMLAHTAAVSRGAKNALILGDMPFLSYQTSVYDAVMNAGRFMKEAGANAVKLEGGARVCPQIRAIVDADIPVCAHIGLTPQSVNAFGGFKVQGKSIEEVRDWAEETKLHLCHQFTVDDLHFLKRGGRISATTAVVGSMLQIKPVLHVDNEGHLINIGKARGRQASLKALVDKMEKTVTEEGRKTVFISHGDCRKDAVTVADMVRERFGTQDIRINFVGPVIGAHSGPGTLALFYLGTER